MLTEGIDNFLRKVKATPEGCWEWAGTKDKYGYGQLKVNRKIKFAHRLAYEFFVEPIPLKLCVCHTCDNPSCVNPKHLFTGTVLDNQRDSIRKSRRPDLKGMNCGHAKLNNGEVLEIRRLHEDGVTRVQLGIMFSVDPTTIRDITSRKTWDHI